MSLYAFIDRVQKRTREVKVLLLPELELYAPERPWSAAALRALAAERKGLDEALDEALEHALTYELPLLEYEESIEDLDDDAFMEKMQAFEEAHWRRFYEEEKAQAEAEGGEAVYICFVHRVRRDRVERLAEQHGVYDFVALAPHIGAEESCTSCRVGTSELLVELLKKAKLEGRLA